MILAPMLGWQPAPASAQAGSASGLIDAVNALRVGQGLPAYKVNSTLMGIAQAHSQYQAAIGSVTHTGAGGTRPRDRAIAAGYGGGATVFVSENIAGGTNLSPQQAVSWWQGDSPHLNTMLNPNYTDVGAGVAVDGDFVYYTLDVGYVSGEAGSGDSGSGDAGTNPSGTGAGPGAVPAPLPVNPIQVSTPRSDGSITHVVQPGQVLISIADAYKVTLADLLGFNGLTRDAIIYPDDKLVIRPALSATPTAPPSATPTRQPPTRRPAALVSVTPAAIELAMALPTEELSSALAASQVELSPPVNLDTRRAPLVIAVVAVAFLSLVTPLVIALRRKP